MCKKILTCVTGVFLMMTGIQSANAQQPGAPRPLIEIYGCNFVGNNDMNDLLTVTARWNAWADRHEQTGYTAIILSPYFFSADLGYDAVWMGVYPDGATMGAGQSVWLAEGQDMQAEFDSVASCDTHQHFVGLVVHEPEGGPPPATGGLIAFQNCKLHHGRRVPEAMAASTQWSEYLAEMGFEGLSGLLVPVAGETGDADYNFKRIFGFRDVAAYGKMLDIITSGGVTRANELFENLMDCDSNRIYVSNRVRAPAAN